MIKILVTGAAGLFGSNLCERLLKNSDDVVVIDNFSTYLKEVVEHIRYKNFIFKATIDTIHEAFENLVKFAAIGIVSACDTKVMLLAASPVMFNEKNVCDLKIPKDENVDYAYIKRFL